jgi:hypothetical protein
MNGLRFAGLMTGRGDGASMGNNDRGRAAPLTSIREDSNMGSGFPKVI